MNEPLSTCDARCFDKKVSWKIRCLWCKLKYYCVNDYNELADRDSDFCRMLNYHKDEILGVKK